MHIVQEVPVYVEPEERKKLDNPPTLMLEYLQGGTLWSFINDKLPKDKTIPSRLLWSFFLCRTWLGWGILIFAPEKSLFPFWVPHPSD